VKEELRVDENELTLEREEQGGFCQHSNEISGYAKFWEYLE
jgi:hypothetical protein